MTFQTIGAARLARLMRSDRVRDLDTSWLLHGPTEDEEAEAEIEVPPHFRIAAE